MALAPAAGTRDARAHRRSDPTANTVHRSNHHRADRAGTDFGAAPTGELRRPAVADRFIEESHEKTTDDVVCTRGADGRARAGCSAGPAAPAHDAAQPDSPTSAAGPDT